MVKSVICTKLKFFEVNTNGRVLNKFSKDINTLDEMVFCFLDLVDVSAFKKLSPFSIVCCEMFDNNSDHGYFMSMGHSHNCGVPSVPSQDS